VSADVVETKKSSIDVIPKSGSISIKRRSSSFRSKEIRIDSPVSRRMSSIRMMSSEEVFYDALESPIAESTQLPTDNSAYSSDDCPIPFCPSPMGSPMGSPMRPSSPMGSSSPAGSSSPVRFSSPAGFCSGFCVPTGEEKPNIVCTVHGYCDCSLLKSLRC
jgi:hypothetical protein